METPVFRQLLSRELPQMLSLIQSRIDWMDRVGIRQWNMTDYNAVYPRSYYRAHIRRGNVFALVLGETVLSAGLLKKRDARWAHISGIRQTDGLYLHHFAASCDHKGCGSSFLALAEAYAKSRGYRYLRLDSASDNPALSRYYTQRGYVPVGECIDGVYHGILRQKQL